MQNPRLPILLTATIFMLVQGCNNTTEPPAVSTIGSARLSITLRNVGELSKSSSIDLQTLFIEMSKGINIIHDTIPLNGNSEVLVTQSYVGMSEGDWSLTAESRDQTDEVIHADSTAFTIIADQTVDVSLSLVSKYSMLIANFLDIAEDVYRCELLVDGSMVADSTFIPPTELEYDIALGYDYLTVGTEHTIKMDAYGEYEGVEYLFYTGDTIITALAGMDASYAIDLEWVGPFGALRGDLIIEVTVGASGMISMNGNFPIPEDVLMDIDGNLYHTILIGEQIWMAENLKVTHYRDGTAITNVTDNNAWEAQETEAFCIYNNNTSNEVDTYGALYNWYAVTDTRNLAPEGWHVPTDEEWKELEMSLGMSQSEADNESWRGTNEGSIMAGNDALWDEGDLENDSEFGSSGFSTLANGYRPTGLGNYTQMGNYGYFWSTTEYNSNLVYNRSLYSNRTTIHRGYDYKSFGLAIRCVKD
jgi:uncharacterized protein (TIGR02145 family)